MKGFIAACVAAIVIAIGAAIVLNVFAGPPGVAKSTTSSVRL